MNKLMLSMFLMSSSVASAANMLAVVESWRMAKHGHKEGSFNYRRVASGDDSKEKKREAKECGQKLREILSRLRG